MVDNKNSRIVIGDKLDITQTDIVMLKNTQRRKRFYFRILSSIEALIGLFSFMGGWVIGYNSANSSSFAGYPFSVILLSKSIPTSLELKKKRGLLLFPVITLLIITLGLISGYALGSSVPIHEPTAIDYDVYSQSLKSS